MGFRLSSVGRGVALVGVVAAACAVARAQGSCTFPDENGKMVTLPNCGLPATPDKKPPVTPNAAGKFPYPGESTTPAAPGTQTPAAQAPGANQTPAAGPSSFPYPGSGAVPADAKPAPPVGDGTQGTGAAGAPKSFPYPGEVAPASVNPDALKDAGSSGESSSSSSSSSSGSGGDIADAGAPATADDVDPAAPKKRRKLPPVVRQTPDEREMEDVKVAAFYQNDGNYVGAYARGKDAVSLDDTDPEAHLALAEAARKLSKLDEAQQHYKKCLELDPLPKDRKVAEKALKEMAGGGA